MLARLVVVVMVDSATDAVADVDVFALSFCEIKYPTVCACDDSSFSRNAELAAAIDDTFVGGLSTYTSGRLYPVPGDFFRSYL